MTDASDEQGDQSPAETATPPEEDGADLQREDDREELRSEDDREELRREVEEKYDFCIARLSSV